jgi:transcription initiation factor TFIID subunit 1
VAISQEALGEFVVLDPSEQEPIPLFCMEAGRQQQTLVNNLIRAPLWEHRAPHTDFLVIRWVSVQFARSRLMRQGR